jgi:type IV pilus assembly protein PilM
MSDGEVTDPVALGKALGDFVSDNDLPRDVRLGVANQQVAVRPLELPPIGPGPERDAAVRFLAADAIAMPLDEAVFDYQIMSEGPGPDGSPRMKVVVVAARQSMVSTVAEAARIAGLRPLGIDLNAFALVRMLAAPATDSSAVVYCHVGDVVNLAIAVGTNCNFTRVLTPVTSPDGSVSGNALGEDIRLSIDFFMVQGAGGQVDRVVLAGPGASRPGLADEVREVVGIDTVVAAPFGSLDASSVAEDESGARYTVAAGLALGESS